MKLLIIMLLTILSLTSYSQGKYPITVSGSGGGSGTSGGRYTTNDFGTLVDSATTNVYKIIVDTTVIASQARLSAMLALKLNITDTVSMLSGYQTAINARVKYTDTSSMLSAYQTAINARVKYTDTSSMLSAYQTAINARVKYTDTASMLSSYQSAIASNTSSLLTKWGLTGSAATAGSSYLGTSNNVSLRIRTNGIEKGSYDSLGNVIQGSGTWQIGQQLLNPSNQRSSQYATDGSYPAQVSIVNTDSVGCVTCTSDSTKAKGLEIAAYEATTGGAFIHFKKARGNYLTPVQVQANDILGGIAAWGYTNASNFSGSTGGFHIIATEAYTSSASGSELQLFTNKTGTNTRSYVTIKNYGGVDISPTSGLSDQTSAFKITATLPSGTVTGANYIQNIQATSINQTSNAYAFNCDILAGATDAHLYSAIRGGNTVAGTGVALFNLSGNYGVLGSSTATTAGYNVALYGFASGGNISTGVFGRAITAKNSATNIGGAFIGRNTGSSPIQIGVYAGLNSTTDPTFISSALLVDNNDQTSPISVFRDNGTVIGTIADGGNFFLGGVNSTASARLQLGSGTTGAGTAPLKLALVAPALNTTPEKFAVEVDSGTNGGKILYTSADAVRNEIQLAAYGELYEDGGSTAITVTTAGTYYQWASSTVGSSLLCTNSAATDNITVASGGGGTYLVNASVSFVGTNSATQKWAVFKNGSRLTNLTSVVHNAGSALQVTTSLTGLVALAATDTIDLRVTSDTNGDTATPAQVNLNITRLSK